LLAQIYYEKPTADHRFCKIAENYVKKNSKDNVQGDAGWQKTADRLSGPPMIFTRHLHGTMFWF